MKGGEAEQYENIEVVFVRGAKATLTIYEDEEEVEKVSLISSKFTRDELNNLMESKGFMKTTASDVDENLVQAEL